MNAKEFADLKALVSELRKKSQSIEKEFNSLKTEIELLDIKIESIQLSE